MANKNENSLNKGYYTFTVEDSQNNSEIESLLQGQKYHSNLSINFNSNQRSKTKLIGECLAELTHLSDLNFIFPHSFNFTDESVQNIFKPLQSLLNLKKLSLQIIDRVVFVNTILVLTELFEAVSYSSQFEAISLTLPELFFEFLDQSKKDNLEHAIQNLTHLKDFRMQVGVADDNSQEHFNEFLSFINQITSLTYLSLEIKYKRTHSYSQELQWKLDDLTNLQELHIISDQRCQLQVTRISELLKKLQALKRLSLQVKVLNFEDQFRLLFNTTLSMKQLEELTVVLDLQEPWMSIKIGEQVCSGSNLTVFNFKLYKNYVGLNRETIVIGREILKINNLEKLCLDFGGCLVSDESFAVLSKWKHQWTKLQELTFECNYQYLEKQSLKMQVYLRDCLFNLRQLIRLRTNINLSSMVEKSNFLFGLASLENLQTLSCKHLYEQNNTSIQQQYVQCFQKLSNLRELSIEFITNKEEVLCIGLSLKYMGSLVSLSINFGMILFLDKQDLEIFYKNLMGLENLKSLRFESGSLFVIGQDFLKESDAKTMLQSVSTLRSLRSLNLNLPLSINQQQKNVFELFSQQFSRLIHNLQQLNILTFNLSRYLNIRINLIRHSKRLVQLMSK